VVVILVAAVVVVEVKLEKIKGSNERKGQETRVKEIKNRLT
jgi:hypothetical protein